LKGRAKEEGLHEGEGDFMFLHLQGGGQEGDGVPVEITPYGMKKKGKR
jgi:hypothetical protein